MMKEEHEYWYEQICLHVVGCLEDEEVKALNLHLEECYECKIYYEEQYFTKSLLANSVKKVSPSKKCDKKIDRQIKQLSSTSTSDLSLPTRMVIFAASVILILVVFYSSADFTNIPEKPTPKTFMANVDKSLPKGIGMNVTDYGNKYIIDIHNISQAKLGKEYSLWIENNKTKRHLLDFIASSTQNSFNITKSVNVSKIILTQKKDLSTNSDSITSSKQLISSSPKPLAWVILD